ncbi:MAG: DegT/DnrJ/EryC1/StrS family aminotransferase, partial [Methyloprofundus sp.]|nr:DegT/DnrJ/EryC1/StrS family aminotransferase [Methyloprofundus sp.]
FETEAQLLKIQKALNDNGIFPRRYFYPSLDTLDYLQTDQVCAHSRDIAGRILCLPIYSELNQEQQNRVIELIKGLLKL